MTKKLTLLLMTTAISIILVACAKEPPKCSDEATITLVQQIILDKVVETDRLSDAETKANIRIDLPRASAFDEKIKKYRCEAKLTVGGNYELPISYESQLDDKNQHIVLVANIDRSTLLTLQSFIVGSIQRSRDGNVVTTAPNASATNSNSPALETQTTGFKEPKGVTTPFKSRFGELFIDAEKVLTFKGKPVSPLIQGNSSLSLVDYQQGKVSDLFIVQDTGGTACPAQYYFVTLSAEGVKQSKVFGTCSDLLKTQKKGELIIVSMPGEKGAHIFTLEGNEVLDNGKPSK